MQRRTFSSLQFSFSTSVCPHGVGSASPLQRRTFCSPLQTENGGNRRTPCGSPVHHEDRSLSGQKRWGPTISNVFEGASVRNPNTTPQLVSLLTRTCDVSLILSPILVVALQQPNGSHILTYTHHVRNRRTPEALQRPAVRVRDGHVRGAVQERWVPLVYAETCCGCAVVPTPTPLKTVPSGYSLASRRNDAVPYTI